MAVETNVGLDTTFLANTDLSSNQFYFVRVTSSGFLATAGSGVTGPRAVGVLQDTPNGTAATPVRSQVRYGGISKVIAGGSFAIGDPISSNSTGQAVKYTVAANSTGFGTGSQVLGFAILAGVTGDTSSIIFSPSGLST